MRVPFCRLVPVAALACVLPSCMVGPNFSTPKSRLETAWVGSSAVSDQPQSVSDALWWRTFRDPVLNTLIETAYKNNPSLQIAGVKVLQARAQLNVGRVNTRPHAPQPGRLPSLAPPTNVTQQTSLSA